MANRKGAATLREVAARAGVSVGTASRVINGASNVKSHIRAKVLHAIEDLGYRPNTIAQSMRRGSTKMVGCIIREINIPSLAAFVRAAQEVLDLAGYSLLLSNSHGLASRERTLLNRLGSQKAEGILFGPYTAISAEFEAYLRDLDARMVLIDRDAPAWADFVLADHAGAMEAATKHLLDLGHRRILLMTGPSEIYPARERIRGYRSAFSKAGLLPEDAMIRPIGFRSAEGFEQLTHALSEPRRPSAVIAGGIDMLPGALRVIRALNLRIPEDISVIDSGDSELAQLYDPPISTTRWDQGEIGRIAAQLLLDRMKGIGSKVPQHILVPVDYIPRGSYAAATRM